MRPIDADALKAHIDKLPALPDGNFAGTHSALKALINMQPTIDAVPVVRCRECYYWESGENPCEKWEYCNFHRIGIGPHDFCSYGERKEAGHESVSCQG